MSKMTGVKAPGGSHRTGVIVLAGFLGSGKTTLLRRILDLGGDLSGIVVVVNELGEVGIDGTLLAGAGSEVIEMTSGCVCCTMKLDLARTLAQVHERFAPRQVIIEATGVAEPGAVASVLAEPGLEELYYIQRVITVLDLRHWRGKKVFGPFFASQLGQAQLILLNKADLADPQTLETCLAEIRAEYPGRPVIPTSFGQVDPELLLGGEPAPAPQGLAASYDAPLISLDSLGRPQAAPPPVGPDGFVSLVFTSDTPLDQERLENFLAGLPALVFRAKGPVALAQGTRLLNYAAGAWDWQDWPGTPETRLVLVGWRMETTPLLEGLRACS